MADVRDVLSWLNNKTYVLLLSLFLPEGFKIPDLTLNISFGLVLNKIKAPNLLFFSGCKNTMERFAGKVKIDHCTTTQMI